MIFGYSVFHLNLMYSSIEEEQRREVVEKCYSPLLELAEDGIPIGIELSGKTLEISKLSFYLPSARAFLQRVGM